LRLAAHPLLLNDEGIFDSADDSDDFAPPPRADRTASGRDGTHSRRRRLPHSGIALSRSRLALAHRRKAFLFSKCLKRPSVAPRAASGVARHPIHGPSPGDRPPRIAFPPPALSH